MTSPAPSESGIISAVGEGKGYNPPAINDAISAHDQTMKTTLAANTKGLLKTVSLTWLTIVMVSFLLICTSGSILWWQGQQIVDHYQLIREMKRTEAMLTITRHVADNVEDSRQYSCVCFVITPVTAPVLPVGRTVNPQ